MRLTTRFNLVLFVVFSLGLASAGYVSHTVLQKHAREEVLHHAGMMMEAAMAIRGYTVKEIRPLLTLQMKREFLPQSVPSYAATQNFQTVREMYPEYTYKEAALNPTNPRDHATDWETDIIQILRNDPETRELSGERDTPFGKITLLCTSDKDHQQELSDLSQHPRCGTGNNDQGVRFRKRFRLADG